MSIGAELRQYVLQTHNSKNFWRFVVSYVIVFPISSREQKLLTFDEYRCPERERERHVNLLLLEDADNPSKQHYVWIKNMSALVSHRTNSQHATFVCNSCLHPFTSQRVLDDHIPYCFQHEPQQIVYPNPHNEKECVLKCRSKHKQHPYHSTWCAILSRFCRL